MGGHKIQSKHTKMHLMGVKDKLELDLVCAGDTNTSGAVAFHVGQGLYRK